MEKLHFDLDLCWKIRWHKPNKYHHPQTHTIKIFIQKKKHSQNLPLLYALSSRKNIPRKMKTLALRSQFVFPTHSNLTSSPKHSPFLISTRTNSHLLIKNTLPKSKFNHQYSAKPRNLTKSRISDLEITPKFKNSSRKEELIPTGYSRYVIVGAVSVGFVMFLMGMEDAQKAWALGPEGPLVEEFWDNMRRYGLYALTVSTGVLYAVFEPIVELLKNPISAILVLVILGGGFYIVSQVVSAMVGASDFSYQYTY